MTGSCKIGDACRCVSEVSLCPNWVDDDDGRVSVSATEHWEARRARRYGSRHMGWFDTEAKARAFADRDIANNGSSGRINTVIPSEAGGTVYYDIYEEMS